MKKQIEIYHSFLTIRLPTARTSDEAKRIIQGEFIRPLTSILKDEFGSIMLGAYGVYAIKPNRHVHLILISTRPLPDIDSKADPQAYAEIRKQLIERHGFRRCQIPQGKNVIELTIRRSKYASDRYNSRHLNRSGSSNLVIAWRTVKRLTYIEKNAA